MKKIKIAVISALILSIVAAVAIYAASYDSSVDPIVSLSYLNDVFKPTIMSKIQELEGKVTGSVDSSKLDELEEKVNDSVTLTYLNDEFAPGLSSAIIGKMGTLEEELKESAASAASYSVIYLTKGQKILTYSSCELILRAGTATVVSPFDDQGLSDITGGDDLLGEVDVPKNHTLIIPRGNDGRGVLVTSNEGAYFMIRGGYTVE